MTGGLYGPAKIAALKQSACFCLPSRQEGFSVAITEALACGVPVAITDACHFPEVAEAGAGAVCSLDPMAVASALEQILEDPDRAKRMGAAGARLVRANYTWPRIALQTIAAYQSFQPQKRCRCRPQGAPVRSCFLIVRASAGVSRAWRDCRHRPSMVPYHGSRPRVRQELRLHRWSRPARQRLQLQPSHKARCEWVLP